MSDVLEEIIVSPVITNVYPLPPEILKEYIKILYEESYPVLEILARPLEHALGVIGQINKNPERKLKSSV
ncbi:MAG TPA: hypothetical protein EYP78_02255 [Candidatus Omnitrophica bacterium]|nr:hypothetical protein [Candidatus Omnitrophota bacterium]